MKEGCIELPPRDVHICMCRTVVGIFRIGISGCRLPGFLYINESMYDGDVILFHELNNICI